MNSLPLWARLTLLASTGHREPHAARPLEGPATELRVERLVLSPWFGHPADAVPTANLFWITVDGLSAKPRVQTPIRRGDRGALCSCM